MFCINTWRHWEHMERHRRRAFLRVWNCLPSVRSGIKQWSAVRDVVPWTVSQQCPGRSLQHHCAGAACSWSLSGDNRWTISWRSCTENNRTRGRNSLCFSLCVSAATYPTRVSGLSYTELPTQICGVCAPYLYGQRYGFSSSHIRMWELDHWRRLSTEELLLLNCGVGEDSWESLGLQGDPTNPS